MNSPTRSHAVPSMDLKYALCIGEKPHRAHCTRDSEILDWAQDLRQLRDYSDLEQRVEDCKPEKPKQPACTVERHFQDMVMGLPIIDSFIFLDSAPTMPGEVMCACPGCSKLSLEKKSTCAGWLEYACGRKRVHVEGVEDLVYSVHCPHYVNETNGKYVALLPKMGTPGGNVPYLLPLCERCRNQLASLIPLPKPT